MGHLLKYDKFNDLIELRFWTLTGRLQYAKIPNYKVNRINET